MRASGAQLPTEPALEQGPRLYRLVRARFVERGDTLNAWCKRSGVTRQWAEQALLGDSSGPAAQELVTRLIEATGLNEHAR